MVLIEQALSEPKLLARVFWFSENSDLARYARVSKTWSNLALDRLWASMSSVYPLLSLLVDQKTLKSMLFYSPVSLDAYWFWCTR